VAKRLFDFLASSVGIILLTPVFLVIVVVIKLDSPGPVFFRQQRVGRGGKIFKIYKFRTMHVDAEKVGGPLTVGRDPRITRGGFWLRKLKLDELPQLVNVWRGEMSLVGPRPEVPKYVAFYSPEQRKVLQVRPGITDLASIEFYDENQLLQGSEDPEALYVTQIMPRKLALNMEYLAKQNVVFDVSIILRTLWRIVARKNFA
jgi:lipopolysaccharide/colanic/teichoic acid biosynthesis glycosyltransferase